MTITLDNSSLSLRSALARLEGAFSGAGAESPRVSAEWTMAAVMQCARWELHARLDEPLNETQRSLLEGCEARAARHEPVQYILGETEFMGLRIVCDPRALIPRPETETLVTLILNEARAAESNAPSIIDVGTGTGCIALALADAWPRAQVSAIDVDAAALALAQENAQRLDMVGRVSFQQGNLLDAVTEGCADIVVANLPYVTSKAWRQLALEVRMHEPRRALDGGPDGLDQIRTLIPQALKVLKPGGSLWLEFGADQAGAVRDALAGAGYSEVVIHPDPAGRDRFAAARRPA